MYVEGANVQVQVQLCKNAKRTHSFISLSYMIVSPYVNGSIAN